MFLSVFMQPFLSEANLANVLLLLLSYVFVDIAFARCGRCDDWIESGCEISVRILRSLNCFRERTKRGGSLWRESQGVFCSHEDFVMERCRLEYRDKYKILCLYTMSRESK